MEVFEIEIKGQVQGVGFRPFVYRLATEMGLVGYVNNTNEGVLIEISVENEFQLDTFCKRLKNEVPKLAKITCFLFRKTNENAQVLEGFRIIKSKVGEKNNVLLSPDFGICAECSNEINDSKNRRFQYAFTTCTYCGPRFSIIKKLPYDREFTSMEAFEMCSCCRQEYESVSDRRYFSQTNSCEKCGVKLRLFDNKKQLVSDEQSVIIDLLVEFLKDGKIVALKGIGGYLLICDASNELTISELRKRKHRPSKPFAVMFPGLESLKKVVDLRDSEQEILINEVASIVLLEANLPNLTTAGLIGVMLPYTPLFELICQKFSKPLIATSGNLSHSPIIYDDQKAMDVLSEIADLILINNREIVVPQDDSVVRFTQNFNQKIVLRRSRGLAPTFILPTFVSQNNILAMGAMLKSTFTLTHENNIYISQYLGDLSDFDTQESFQHTLKHITEVLDFKANTVLIDKHSAYPSSEMGRIFAEEKSLNLVEIQHHKAHFAAVLAENDLLKSTEPILGIIWDGTGLGEDGHIWGGEFFKFQNNANEHFERVNHVDYFPNLLGDKMAREPRLSALSICANIPEAYDFIKAKFTDLEWNLYQKQLKQANLLQTSSVGRLFDAVASLLRIIDKVSYEGESAMYLEAKARAYFKQKSEIKESYFTEKYHNSKEIIRGVIADLIKEINIEEIAYKVHYSMICLIKNIANDLNINKIAFSGGVWQNALLVDLAQQNLTDFELFFHQQLSPNDECISFGQVVVYELMNRKLNN
ncbi:carbamoyltransferase HypF [Emticicia sp. SJ17W-69]|uniref:carbamoyltransferase HypF n=1 Tax=Emticicia sp. SJ17W-69 TaxID=3421657 RepID=UPI003EBA0C38